MIHKFNIVLILFLLGLFFYFAFKAQYIPAITILITVIVIPVIFDPENFKKEEICKYVQDGKCYIDDMTDKYDCTGKDHDLEHCGDYQAYKAEEETNG